MIFFVKASRHTHTQQTMLEWRQWKYKEQRAGGSGKGKGQRIKGRG